MPAEYISKCHVVIVTVVFYTYGLLFFRVIISIFVLLALLGTAYDVKLRTLKKENGTVLEITGEEKIPLIGGAIPQQQQQQQPRNQGIYAHIHPLSYCVIVCDKVQLNICILRNINKMHPLNKQYIPAAKKCKKLF